MYRRRGREMLRDRGGKLSWEVEGPPFHSAEASNLSGWTIGEAFVLLHEYPEGNGFEIYQPVNKENTLPALANALDELCGSVVNTPR